MEHDQGNSNGNGAFRCYTCGGEHLARNCPQNTGMTSTPVGAAAAGMDGKVSSNMIAKSDICRKRQHDMITKSDIYTQSNRLESTTDTECQLTYTRNLRFLTSMFRAQSNEEEEERIKKKRKEEEGEREKREEENSQEKERSCDLQCGRCGACTKGIDLMQREQRESLAIAKNPVARIVEVDQRKLELKLAQTNYNFNTYMNSDMKIQAANLQREENWQVEEESEEEEEGDTYMRESDEDTARG